LAIRIADAAKSDIDTTRSAIIPPASFENKLVARHVATWIITLQIKDIDICNALTKGAITSNDTFGACYSCAIRCRLQRCLETVESLSLATVFCFARFVSCERRALSLYVVSASDELLDSIGLNETLSCFLILSSLTFELFAGDFSRCGESELF